MTHEERAMVVWEKIGEYFDGELGEDPSSLFDFIVEQFAEADRERKILADQTVIP